MISWWWLIVIFGVLFTVHCWVTRDLIPEALAMARRRGFAIGWQARDLLLPCEQRLGMRCVIESPKEVDTIIATARLEAGNGDD